MTSRSFLHIPHPPLDFPQVLKTIETNRKIHELVYRLYPHLSNGSAEPPPPPPPTAGAGAGAGAGEENSMSHKPPAEWRDVTADADQWRRSVEAGTVKQAPRDVEAGNRRSVDAGDIYTSSANDASASGGREQRRSCDGLNMGGHVLPVAEVRFCWRE